MIGQQSAEKKCINNNIKTLSTLSISMRSCFDSSHDTFPLFSWLKVKGMNLTPFQACIEADALFLYTIKTMIGNMMPFLPLTTLLQVRVTNKTICSIIEFTDVFANQFSKALHKLNPVTSPIEESVEAHSDPEAEAILLQEEAEEEEYQRRARSRSVRRLHRKQEKHRRKKNDENVFSDSSTS